MVQVGGSEDDYQHAAAREMYATFEQNKPFDKAGITVAERRALMARILAHHKGLQELLHREQKGEITRAQRFALAKSMESNETRHMEEMLGKERTAIFVREAQELSVQILENLQSLPAATQVPAPQLKSDSPANQ